MLQNDDLGKYGSAYGRNTELADVVTSAPLCRVCTTSGRLTIQPVGRNYWCTPSAGSANVLVFAKYKLKLIQVLDNSLFFCFCLFVHDQKQCIKQSGKTRITNVKRFFFSKVHTYEGSWFYSSNVEFLTLLIHGCFSWVEN